MLPTNTIENAMLSVFSPPASLLLFLPITEPASASMSPIGAYRPMKITTAVERLKNKVLAEEPEEVRAVVRGCRGELPEHLGETRGSFR